MTVAEAISGVDRLMPNQYPETTKINWLSKLDGLIFKEVFLTHEGNPTESFDGYDESSQGAELLVPYPYDADIYNYFLQAQICKENGEIGKYNHSMTLYNNAFLAFQNWYNRTHTPLPSATRFKF